ncbi:hypothetical protein, partial [uncultured Gemmiger sp.]|uniref:hypothetical protein n=1 Tax=uncultured Gemmiger sp. TaxID=1623490 RepID=UPI0025FC112B
MGLVDVAIDRKFFFALFELVLCRGITDQLDFHSDGMPSRVCGIKRLCCGKARFFFEFKRLCAVCKRQVDWNLAAVRRAVIAALNGRGFHCAPNLRPRVSFGNIDPAAPFCRASGGYIDPAAFAVLLRIVKGEGFVLPHHGRFARLGGSGHDKPVLNLGRIVVRRAAVCFQFVFPRCSSGFFAGFFVCGIFFGSRRRILCRVFVGACGRGILIRAVFRRGGRFLFLRRRCRGFRLLRCSDRLFRLRFLFLRRRCRGFRLLRCSDRLFRLRFLFLRRRCRGFRLLRCSDRLF